MNVAFGWKAHSGWAALVVIGEKDGVPVVADRRRVELVTEEWAKQPYHAAEDLDTGPAAELVRRGVSSAHRIAVREVRAAVAREKARHNVVVASAVLVGAEMPAWSVAEILAVHLRMHQAEGVLFRDALARAATACGLPLVTLPEKRPVAAALAERIASLGKPLGAPWGKDQKGAALA